MLFFMLTSRRVIDRRAKSRSGQTKDNKISICWFFTSHAVFRRKSKDWLAQNQDNVSEWSAISKHGCIIELELRKIQISFWV